jgi:hypothetical protein
MDIENLVVWSIFALSVCMIGGITYLTLRDLMKYDQEHLSVLKDQYTVFFVTFALLGLLIKISILDTNIKDELHLSRSCSMFMSDYLPQFFITLSSLLVAAKSVNIVLLIKKDTQENYS